MNKQEFLYELKGKLWALSEEEKNQVSHRANALKKLYDVLKERYGK